jgi:hypothetical protein
VKCYSRVRASIAIMAIPTFLPFKEMAAAMPAVTKQLDKLRGDALTLKGYFAELQAKTWARPLPYNRYLQQS